MYNTILSLDEIALDVGADKSSAHHNYTPTYERLFEPRRHDPVRLLELGWGFEELPGGAGASAKVWERYFTHPDAGFVFIDIAPHNPPTGRTFLLEGDQADRSLADQLGAGAGPWDFIIDDASHLSSKTIASFHAHFPHLASGGAYIVEDVHSSYHAHYYGDTEANPNPDRPPRGPGARTAMQFFKRLADEVNRDFHEERFHLGYDLSSVTFLRDMVIVIKA